MLIVQLPLLTEGAATEYFYVLSGDGERVDSAASAVAMRLPAQAGEVVATVPPLALSWHSVRVPPVNAARLPQVLAASLEDQLLEDAALVHIVAPANAPEIARLGGQLTVLACSKTWLRSALAPLQAQGLVVNRIVPLCPARPLESPCLVASGTAQNPQAVLCDVNGAVVLPPLPWPTHLSAALHGNNLALLAEPAVLQWLQDTMGRPVTLVAPAQRCLLALGHGWDLAQGEWAQGRRLRAWRSAHTQWRHLRTAPRWRAARLGVASLLAINLLALPLMAWRANQQQQDVRQQMARVLTSSFPSVPVVVDAPLQMQREMQRLLRAHGVAAPPDLEPMLAALYAALPAGTSLTQLQFSTGELHWQAQGLDPDAAQSSATQLAAAGYQLQSEGTGWLLKIRNTP